MYFVGWSRLQALCPPEGRGGVNIFDWSVKFTSQIFSGWGKCIGLVGQDYKLYVLRRVGGDSM